MSVIKIILSIILVLDCIALVVVVLMQQGKGQGLGAIAGTNMTDNTYWSKNKGRSKEGKLKKITRILCVAFFVLAIVLNINF